MLGSDDYWYLDPDLRLLEELADLEFALQVIQVRRFPGKISSWVGVGLAEIEHSP